MASYKLVIDKRVRKKDLPSIPKLDLSRILERIAELSHNPRPTGAEKLTNQPGYRLRQGDYRILYLIDDAQQIVRVAKVAHRRAVYRNQ
ncbi:MAG TPA: type II toxin-antitoxin system RelE/ParE family toxin [Candidatus Saccharimonadales bacterium]|nr:type II toxin-antitoxin system RelE/ParE family toxin [Candidatus Saccharimonadales bacterium]